MPDTAHHGLHRRAGDASDVIASTESPSYATASTIPACSSHVLAVAVRMHVAVLYSAVVT